MSQPIVFVAAKRTPFGSFGGSLKNVSATDLAVASSEACLKQAPISPGDIDHVVFGNVLQTSSDALYLARHVGLKCKLPIAVPAVTVNRLCGSGFEAISQGAQLIQTKRAKTVLVGGTENMSQSPYVLRGARFGYKMSNQTLEDSLSQGLFDTFAQMPMAITAENLSEKYRISREECDQFALLSQKRAAQSLSILEKEIAPFPTVKIDEHIRPDASAESLGKLKPVFKKEGVVTAGNASGMVDGAASSVMTIESVAIEKKWPVLGSYIDSIAVGCDPTIMGIGPVPAIQAILKRNNLSISEIHLFEINEAFAPQILAVNRELKIPTEKLNIHGGAIAIGHPLGASGTRLVNHLLYSLHEIGGGWGIAAACIGGGQGMAVLIRV